MLQLADLDHAFAFSHPDPPGEIADRGGRKTAPAQARQGGQARVVPAGDATVVDQLDQAALREHGVRQTEPRELVLAGPRGHRKRLEQPVVKRPMILEFEGTDRMGHPLDGVALAVREIVIRINAPGLAGAWVGAVQDAVEHRVTEIDIAGGHVDLGAQHPGAVGELAGAHAAKQVEIFVFRAVAERAVGAGLGEGAAPFADLVGALVVDIGLAGANQMFGPGEQLVEIIRCEVLVLAPVEAEPTHIGLDGVDIFLFFLDRIGVVETQMTAAAELLRQAEVEANRLGMTDMQVAVGLGRKPGDHGLGAPGLEIGAHDIADEIGFGAVGRGVGFGHGAVLRGVVQPCLPENRSRAKHRSLKCWAEVLAWDFDCC